MGAVGGLLGLSGGAAGTGFAGPSSANIQKPTTEAQAGTAYTGTQSALQQQQSLLNALQGQNGLQNQNSVYNQLSGIVNGQGPNPAQTMLNQATGANVANQASLMAGQRGAGQNVGLIARQAAQQGSQIQQAAAGQAATQQANQSLGALGQQQNLATQQAGQQIAGTGAVTGAQTAEQGQLLNAIGQQNNAAVGMQSNVNTANADLSKTQMAGQQNLIGNITGGIGSALSLADGGQVPQMYAYGSPSVDYNNQDNVDYSSSPTASGATDMSTVGPQAVAAPSAPLPPPQAPAAPTAPAAPNQPSSFLGKFMKGATQSHTAASGQPQGPQGMGIAGQAIGKGIGSALNSLFGSGSSSTPTTFNGQNPDNVSKSEGQLQNQLLQSGDYTGTQQDVDATNTDSPDPDRVNSAAGGNITSSKGGKVPALVSPGEVRIHAKDVPKVVKGEKSPMSGEKIKGKAKVSGAVNSYANDTVPKDLNEGDIILPRSVTQSKHPHWEAKKFVEAVMAKKGLKKGLK